MRKIAVDRGVATGGALNSLLFDYQNVNSIFPYRADDKCAVGLSHNKAIELFPSNRKMLSSVINDYKFYVKNETATPRAVRRITAPDVSVVLARHNCSLFGGPLQLIYKAMSVARFASDAQARGLGKFVPVLLLDTEDASRQSSSLIDSISSNSIWSRDILDSSGVSRSMSSIGIDGEYLKTLKTFESRFISSPYSEDIQRTLEVKDCNTVVEHVRAILEETLSSLGVIYLDTHSLRPLAGQWLWRHLRNPTNLAQALSAGDTHLRSLGIRSSISDTTSLKIHWIEGVRRYGIEATPDNAFRLSDGRKLNERTVLRQALREPWRFSPDKDLSILMMCSTLPVSAFIGDEQDIDSLALLHNSFNAMGVHFPQVTPVFDATLYPESLYDVVSSSDGVSDISKKIRASEAKDSVESAKKIIADFENSVSSSPLENDSQLSALSEAIDTLRSSVKETKIQTGIGSTISLLDEALPLGRPQSEVFSFLTYIARYGNSLVGDLYENIEPWNSQSQMFFL